MEAIIRYRLLDKIWGSLAFLDVYKNGQQLPKTALSFAAGHASHKPGPSVSRRTSGWQDSRRWPVFYPRRSGFQIRSHNELDALSAATAMALTVLFLVRLLIHRDAISCWKTTCSHFDWKVCHPLYSISRSSYLAYFLLWASWHRVSHGTVSSITISFFVLSDIYK